LIRKADKEPRGKRTSERESQMGLKETTRLEKMETTGKKDRLGVAWGE